MKAKTKKRIKIFGFLIFFAALVFSIFILYGNHRISKIPGMSYKDVLNYTTQGNEYALITVGIIRNGKMEYTVYGNNGTVLPQYEYEYEIGSLTKSFTTSLISKAISEAKMDLDAPINNYILLPQKAYYPTLASLVTHTSGYKAYYFDRQMVLNFFGRQSNDFYGITIESIINRVGETDLKDKAYPWVYSNFGMAVAGQCVAEAYEKDYRSLMNEFVQTDLQLKDTRVSDGAGDLTGYWQWKENDAYLPAGALISNISDMMQYCKLHMTEEIQYLALTHEKLIDVEGSPASFEKMGIREDAMAMGWILDEQNGIIWHNGGTSKFNSFLAFDKDRQIGVVILSNLAPNYRIPATVMGMKLIKQLQTEP